MNPQIDPLRLLQPRKKDRIWNISQLLSQKSIASPQKMMSQRLFVQHERRKTITPNFSSRMQTTKNISNPGNKMNFQHYRMNSSLKRRNSQFLLKRSLTQSSNTSPLKIKQSLLKQAGNFQLHRQVSLKGLEMQRNQLKQQSIRSQFLVDKNSQLSVRLFDSQIQPTSHHLAKSSQFKKKINPLPQQPHDYNSPQANRKNNFLKKGTSLQKQIVVNLLKNKILKQHELEIERQYTMKDIVSMVKVYKGFHKSQPKNPEQFISFSKSSHNPSIQKFSRQKQYMDCPLNVVKHFKKSIQGWEIQPEFELDS